ncbi:MAG: undecaprenyldiphospho-muramoylpentapeptide beta-N-acetylglucosaminyltransferase [Brachymonas sp.]|nr:undecaprenyldiphospho-muramoylpentapeptide beta-N-acetylglucosaminyltransferase [Brachymonas sp.]
MAGGTGGHIFPGLAVAEALREQGWRVHWLGGPASMEQRLVPPRGFAFEQIDFSGVRGKGVLRLALLPMQLLKAFWQSIQVIRRVKPDVVVGLGGYITFPAGMMAVLLGKPLILHEQNSVAGMANKVLAGVADRIFTTFPNALPKGVWIGNPLRKEFLQQAPPQERLSERVGVKKLLVVGGSLGAKALNETVPQALALIPEHKRPGVIHQGGEKQMDGLHASYEASGIKAELTPFIADTASAFAQADLVICRAGASTVSELAAVGAPAILVPFPHAVDDHQTRNAQFLSLQGAAILLPQQEMTAQKLAQLLQNSEHSAHISIAQKAYSLRKTDATEQVTKACEELTGKNHEARDSSYSFRGHWRRGHERHRRGLAELGLYDLRFGCE